jgi:hypothetical protein
MKSYVSIAYDNLINRLKITPSRLRFYIKTKEEVERALRPGQLWWDQDHKWSDGSNDLDICYLILSGDMGELDGKEVMIYRCAHFMWGTENYCGSFIREFTEDEIRLMKYVGNISSIKSF